MCLAVQHQGHQVALAQPTLLERLEPAYRRPDVAAGDTRPAQAKGFRHRLGDGPLVPAAQPVEDPPQHPLIRHPGLLQPVVALRGDFDPGLPVLDAGHPYPQLLVR
jgi:hypothetical protein